ncbi:hypothetical protein V8C42DRAFT_350931 [Trichoderma barbatum]
MSESMRALIVGGTSGVGYGIACRIAGQDKASAVTIIGRTKPADIPYANIEFRQLDVSLMRNIKEFTDTFKSAHEPKLDLLVVSQGLLSLAGRTETSEGIDRKMALHYYGRQLFVRELLPVLKDDAKVLFVLDGIRGSPDKLNWDDLDLKRTFSLGNAAGHCGSMLDAMIQQYAAQELDSGTSRHFVHASPGIVKSNLGRDLPWYVRALSGTIGSLIAVSPEACGENMVKGLYKSVETDELWACIDGKGNSVAGKAVWTDAQRDKVAKHTWKTIDSALE